MAKKLFKLIIDRHTLRQSINDKKYLEIYSDLPRPLLAEYSFFKGLSGGKLLYTSIIDGTLSNSKLKIEDFKVINATKVFTSRFRKIIELISDKQKWRS